MSGLIARFLLLVAAASMSGITAFDVSYSPGTGNNDPALLSPEVAAGSALGSGDLLGPEVRIGPSTGGPSRGPLISDHLSDVAAVTAARFPKAPNRTELKIAFGGDILIHNGMRSVASTGDDSFDFYPMLAPLQHVLADADLALCHLEVPLTSSNTDLSSYPRFNAPHEVADAVARVGFDGCSTASNHALDQGVEGLVDTLDILDEAGLGHAGTARSKSEANEVTMYEVDDVTVAHIAGTYWLNGLTLPQGMEWAAQRLDVEQILSLAASARFDGADLVVVSVHCCTEYRSDPTPEQVELFRRLSGSPFVDLVVGHHSHVVGPVAEIDGELVVYGLGNLLSGQLHRVDTREGVVVMATARWTGVSWTVVEIAAVPTFVEGRTYSVAPTSADSASFARVMEALNSDGVAVQPYHELINQTD